MGHFTFVFKGTVYSSQKLWISIEHTQGCKKSPTTLTYDRIQTITAKCGKRTHGIQFKIIIHSALCYLKHHQT